MAAADTHTVYDTIIIGSGAAGLSAGLYAVRYKLKTLIIKGEFGGETARAGVIWNYPGVMGIDGYELMKVMEKQGKEGGALFQDGKATAIRNNRGCYEVEVRDKTFIGKTIIFAVGTERGHLGLPNETELTSKGVHYCFTCDSPLYAGKKVAVVGGGDAAFKGALLAAEYCEKIYMLIRSNKLRAEPATIEKVTARKNVEIVYNTEVKEIVGTEKLEKLVLTAPVEGSTDLTVDGLFIEIGARPNTVLATAIGVELDEVNYVKADPLMRTNVPGFFAAGDTVNLFGHFKQDITAAALGSVAATSAYHYVNDNPNLCELRVGES